MTGGMRVLAGECTITCDGSRECRQRGRMIVVYKPDNTVLVHDTDGYQPVAWLTRAENVWVQEGTLTAIDGDQRLHVETHQQYDDTEYPTSRAGSPVGDCPDCSGTLVRTGGAVECLDCSLRHSIPRDASVLTDQENCDCGKPKLQVERGRTFEVCVDQVCESLDERVRSAFDREWDCPECGSELRILRRGGLIAGCAEYPDCDTGWGIPAGTVVDTCRCGLPIFETKRGRRCLKTGCEQSHEYEHEHEHEQERTGGERAE